MKHFEIGDVVLRLTDGGPQMRAGNILTVSYVKENGSLLFTGINMGSGAWHDSWDADQYELRVSGAREVRTGAGEPLFARGAILELLDNNDIGAPVGSTCRVTEDCMSTSDYVQVVWIETGNGSARAGGYFARRFKLATPGPVESAEPVEIDIFALLGDLRN